MIDPNEAAQVFLHDFMRTEYALKRSGYLRKNKEIAEADWECYAKNLGGHFFNHIVENGFAKTLIGHPPRRLLAKLNWAPKDPNPIENVHQLIINGVCRIRNNYIHGEKFTGGPEGQWERDTLLVAEAQSVLNEAWIFDPELLPKESFKPV